MPTFRVPLGGVAGQRAQMSNDPRFVPPLITIGEDYSKQINALKKTLTTLRQEFTNLTEKKDTILTRFTKLSDTLRDKIGDDWPSKLPQLQKYKQAYEQIEKLKKEIEKLTTKLAKSATEDNNNKNSIQDLQNEMTSLNSELVKRRAALDKAASDPKVGAIINAIKAALAFKGEDTPDSITRNLEAAIGNYTTLQDELKTATQKRDDIIAAAERERDDIIARARKRATDMAFAQDAAKATGEGKVGDYDDADTYMEKNLIAKRKRPDDDKVVGELPMLKDAGAGESGEQQDKELLSSGEAKPKYRVVGGDDLAVTKEVMLTPLKLSAIHKFSRLKI